MIDNGEDFLWFSEMETQGSEWGEVGGVPLVQFVREQGFYMGDAQEES